jgi:hypothetical protein
MNLFRIEMKCRFVLAVITHFWVAAAQDHIPTSAATTFSAAPTGNASTYVPPNIIPRPASIPSITNNRTITVTNTCPYDIWPALLTANNTGPYTNGFHLAAQSSLKLWVSYDWTGRIWARTNCSFNETSHTGPCFTGSCANVLDCQLSGQPPTTLAEFNLLGWQNLSYWDISLVNGYNLPIAIYSDPTGLDPTCQFPPTTSGILATCPQELLYYADAPVSYNEVAGCMSACDRYGDAKYCCTGGDNKPNKCGPSRFSKPFKEMCPDAYTYAFDDATSTFASNTGPQYSFEVVFCPGTYSCSKCTNNFRRRLNRLSPWRCWKIKLRGTDLDPCSALYNICLVGNMRTHGPPSDCAHLNRHCMDQAR